jgi:hypothetical protein
MDLQRFIAGEVSMSMALAIGMLKSQAQELRDRVERGGYMHHYRDMCQPSGVLLGKVVNEGCLTNDRGC